MTKNEFLDSVATEIEAIKKNATPQQLIKLDFDDFDPGDHKRCIYGQMTGDCFNEEATRLILACCTPLLYRGTDSCIDDDWKGQNNNFSRLFSPLENFIENYSNRNEDILSYLKGENSEFPRLVQAYEDDEYDGDDD